MIRVVLLIAAVAILALPLWGPIASCGPGDCTDIGCDSGVTITFSKRQPGDEEIARIKTCVDGCATAVIGPKAPRSTELGAITSNRESLEDEDQVRVVFTTFDRGGAIISRQGKTVDLEEFRPNGDGCDPVCRVAELEFDRTDLILRDPEL